jgi:hypothetical protein
MEIIRKTKHEPQDYYDYEWWKKETEKACDTTKATDDTRFVRYIGEQHWAFLFRNRYIGCGKYDD